MTKYHLTRTEKTTTEPRILDDILIHGTYMVLALCRDNEPYVVTLSYGYERESRTLYCHCAKEGLKLDFIRANKHVCGTVFIDGGYIQGECGQPYRSVVFRGTAEEVTDLDGKKHGMSVLLGHLENDPSIIQTSKLDQDKRYNAFTILRITIDEMTGKKGR